MASSPKRSTIAKRRPLARELRQDYQATLRIALRFMRLLLDQHPRSIGLGVREIAEALDVSSRHAHRLIRAAEHAGWPLECLNGRRNTDTRWRMVS